MAVKPFLKKLKTTSRIAKLAGLYRVDDNQAREALGLKPSGTSLKKSDYSGIAFPGFDLSGTARGVYVVRRDKPDVENGKEKNKYMSHAGSEDRYLYCLPGADKKKDATVVLVESAKSVLAIESFAERNKQKLVAVAIGGCHGWKRRIDDERSVPIADLDSLKDRDVLINLDSNVETNPVVGEAEKELAAHLLTKVKARSVRCVHMVPEEGINGPDDYLGKHNDKRYAAVLKAAKEPWLFGSMFATYEALSAAKEPDFLISPVLQDQGITFLGALPGHGKTWVLLSLIKALLSKEKLFGFFAVKRTVDRVLYLSPEVQLGQVKTRLEKFGLMEFVKERRLLIRSLSEGPAPKLFEPDVLMAARGAVVVLDTAVRFAEGKENAAESNRDGLSAKCFAVLEAGAVCVIASHHAPKDLENATHLSLQNVMRGSGDIGAMLSGAWGLFQTNDLHNHVYVANLKPRDMDKFDPFIIAGRPHINEVGDFRILTKPGECPPFADCRPKTPRAGRPTAPANEDKLTFVRELLEKRRKEPSSNRRSGQREVRHQARSPNHFEVDSERGEEILMKRKAGGRPSFAVTQKRRQEAVRMMGEGKSQAEIARTLGVSNTAVCLSLKELRKQMATATQHDFEVYRKGQLAILETIEDALLENQVTAEVAREWRQIRGDIAALLGLNAPQKSVAVTAQAENAGLTFEFLRRSHGLSEDDLQKVFAFMDSLPREKPTVDASYFPEVDE